jgi:cell division protein FtsB
MYRSMNLKGFLLILGIMLAVFLILHSALKGTVNQKAEEERFLRVKKTKLEEDFKRLNKELNVVGTDEYIMSSAVRDYSYVKKDAIRFEFTNPEVLYAYSEEELQILMDEMND